MNDTVTISQTTILEGLGARIAAVTYDSLTPDALHWAKVAILDTVGCTLAGAQEDCARIIGQAATYGTAGGDCLVFGTDRRVGPLDAALINGTAAHALDYDDCSNTLGGHPSAPVVPALFALAEMHNLSGKDFLTAYVAGRAGFRRQIGDADHRAGHRTGMGRIRNRRWDGCRCGGRRRGTCARGNGHDRRGRATSNNADTAVFIDHFQLGQASLRHDDGEAADRIRIGWDTVHACSSRNGATGCLGPLMGGRHRFDERPSIRRRAGPTRAPALGATLGAGCPFGPPAS